MSLKEQFICSLCGGKYFPHSLPHHQKVCAKKHGIPLSECEYCQQLIPSPERTVHIQYRCDKIPKQKLAEMTEHLDLQPDTLDGRTPCVHCNRKFLRTRLETHENICAQLGTRSRPPFNSFHQRAISGSKPCTVKIRNLKDFITCQTKDEKDLSSTSSSSNHKNRKAGPVFDERHSVLDSVNNQDASLSKAKTNARSKVVELGRDTLKLDHSSENSKTASSIQTPEKKAQKSGSSVNRHVSISSEKVARLLHGSPLNSEFGKDSSLITGNRWSSRSEPGNRLTKGEKPKIIQSNISSPENPLVTGWD